MTQLLGETGRKKMLKYDVLHNKLSSFNTLFILALYFVFVHKIIFGVTRYRSQYMVKMDPGGGTWVFFAWVCAARDSKLAPRSKENFS